MSNSQERKSTQGKSNTRLPDKPRGSQALPARWVEVLCLVVLIGLTVLLFKESLSAEFTYDDYVTVVNQPLIRHWHFWDLWDFGDEYFGWRRHVRTLSLMLDYSLFGISPAGYHAHNLLWHALSVVFLYVVLKGLSGRFWVSLFGALIFAIHPIHVEVVTNITNRKDLLCMAFMLAAFNSYVWFLEGVGLRRWAWLTGAIVAWILALFSKQVALLLPLSLMAYEFLFVPRDSRVLTKNRLLLSGGVIFGGALLLAYVLAVEDLGNLYSSQTFKGYSGELSLYSVALTSARVFWRYIELLIWPSELCPDHLVQLSNSLLDPVTLLSWAGLVAVVVMAFQVAQRAPLLSFGLFWFLINYLPVSNLIPTAYILADRYMYIPSAGFCIVLVCLGETMYQKLRSAHPRFAVSLPALIAGVIFAGYAAKTIAYNAHWKSESTIWQYALGCNPQSFRAYTNLGNDHYRAGSYQEAIRDLTKAIELGFTDAYNNRGNVYYALKNYDAAIRDYDLAIKARPDWAKAFYDRGLVSFSLGKYDEAIEYYDQALELDPEYSEGYNNRGLAYENLDRLNEALEDYSKASQLNRYNAAAHNNLGRVLFYSGNVEAAIRSYERAEQLGLAEATKILEFLRKGDFGPESIETDETD